MKSKFINKLLLAVLTIAACFSAGCMPDISIVPRVVGSHTVYFQNRTDIPSDSIKIRREVTFSKYANLGIGDWKNHDYSGSKVKKLTDATAFTFRPMVVFTYPFFTMNCADIVLLDVRLPAENAAYYGNQEGYKSDMSLNNSKMKTYFERCIALSITPDFLPALQKVIENDDRLRIIELNYQAFVLKTDHASYFGHIPDYDYYTGIHDTIKLCIWRRGFEVSGISSKVPEAVHIRSFELPNERFFSTLSEPSPVDSEHVLPYSFLYKGLVLLPQEIKEFREQLFISCRISDTVLFRKSQSFNIVLMDSLHRAANDDTVQCRLDGKASDHILATIKHASDSIR